MREVGDPDGTAGVLARLERDGFLRLEGGRWRTTQRWQGAMARAAFRLMGSGDDGSDLRVPIAYALVEAYSGADEQELSWMVEALVPIEAREVWPGDLA